MQKKIFIGISLPDSVKKRLVQGMTKWPDLPVKWVPIENLHSTLLFLGYVHEDNVGEICEAVRVAASDSESFDLLFERIGLAPEDDPRMVWLKGAENEAMRDLAEKLEQKLKINAAPKKHFRPHVTLGRLRHEKWAALPEKPEIDQKFSVSVPASSVEIFESILENGKSKFVVLESCPLS